VEIGTALWLGILTSLSPCPLATNIAAISFVSRDIGSTYRVILRGLLYTLGRVLAYVLLGALIVWSLLSLPVVAQALQNHMPKIVGPILLLVGFILLEWVSFGGFDSKLLEKARNRITFTTLWGPVALGVLFALSFCPVSAGLFFGSLVPLALSGESVVLLPTVYGVGTALPVIGFAFLIAFSTKMAAVAFGKLAVFEAWARKVTAWIFIMVGLYLTATALRDWLAPSYTLPGF